MSVPWFLKTMGPRPWALDTFCCEGGVSAGLARAGFSVFGVDLFRHRNAAGKLVGHVQSRYPFPSHQGDAIDFIRRHGRHFDVVLGSPPCWRHSAGTRAQDRSQYPDLIAATREAMVEAGRPWVIENVEGAASELHDPMLLCGRMFGLVATDEDGAPLVLERHRLFESSVPLVAPTHPVHDGRQVAGVYGGAHRVKKEPGDTLASLAPRDRRAAKAVRGGGYVPRSKTVRQALLGVDWMTDAGMNQCIPPTYAEFIGRQLRAALDV